MKKIALLILLCSSLIAEDQTITRPIRPYLDVGYSKFLILPYGVNAGAGIRTTIDGAPFGIDFSINQAFTPISSYTFVKTMIPIYLSRKDPGTSRYLGPYTTFGREYPNKENLMIGGIAYGKNSSPLGLLTFTQVNINLVQVRSKIEFFPSVTIQAGIGF